MPGTPGFGDSPRPSSPAFGGVQEAPRGEAAWSPLGDGGADGRGPVKGPKPPCSTPKRFSSKANPLDELDMAQPSEAGSPSFGGANDMVWPEDRYHVICTVGEGCFGSVALADSQLHGCRVAVKCVKPDAGREVREVELMRTIQHPNVVPLLDCFEAIGQDGQRSLHIVMEYLPKNLHERIAGRPTGPSDLRVFGFQMLRALAHLDGMSICHRDLKPENIMIGLDRSLKLCDFGSAKTLHEAQPSSPYICARWWRAPELVLGCKLYTTATDWWSCGCVLAEMMRGRPLFNGTSSWGQMEAIVSTLGAPSELEVPAFAKLDANEQSIKDLAALVQTQAGAQPKPWPELLPAFANLPEAIQLVSWLLKYDPAARRKPAEALCCPLFHALVEDPKSLPPRIFEFTAEELKACRPESRQELTSLAQKCRAELERLEGPLPQDRGDVLFEAL